MGDNGGVDINSTSSSSSIGSDMESKITRNQKISRMNSSTAVKTSSSSTLSSYKAPISSGFTQMMPTEDDEILNEVKKRQGTGKVRKVVEKQSTTVQFADDERDNNFTKRKTQNVDKPEGAVESTHRKVTL